MCFCEDGTESLKYNADEIFTPLLSEGRAENLPTNWCSYLSLLGNKLRITSTMNFPFFFSAIISYVYFCLTFSRLMTYIYIYICIYVVPHR